MIQAFFCGSICNFVCIVESTIYMNDNECNTLKMYNK